MNKKTTAVSICLLLLSLCLHSQDQPTLILGGKIVPVSGENISNGMILVHKGKIIKIDRSVENKNYRVIDAGGGWVLPGLIESHAAIGADRKADETSDPCTPYLRIIDGVNPFDKQIVNVREGGITTMMASPGRRNVIGGQTAVMKLAGKTADRMAVLEPAGIKFSLGEGPKNTYGKKNRLPSTRMGSAYVIRKALLDAQHHLQKKEKKRDLNNDALVKLLTGELKAYIECYRADDIMTALRLTDEFKLKTVLVGCTEGYRVADEISRRNIPVILSTYGLGPRRMETQDLRLDTAAVLHRAGVTVVLKSEGVLGMGHFRELPLLAALSVKHGFPEEAALRAITITAAEVLGVSDRIGSLEAGKDADLVIFDGDPFDYKTRITQVFINGELVFELKKK